MKIKSFFVSLGIVLFITSFGINAKNKCIETQLHNEDGYKIVPIMIQNHVYHFMLDTGASFDLTLRKESLDKIQKRTSDRLSRSCDLTGNCIFKTEYLIDKVNIGHFELSNVKVVEDHHESGVAITKNQSEQQFVPKVYAVIDGIVGMGIFNRFNFGIDYNRNRLYIGDYQECFDNTKSNWSEMPFLYDAEGISISLSDSDHVYKMVLDTGATHSLFQRSSVPKSAVISAMKDCDSAISDNKECKIYSIQKSENLIQPKLPDFILLEFREPKADAILGQDFFTKHVLHFDHKKKQLYFLDRP